MHSRLHLPRSFYRLALFVALAFAGTLSDVSTGFARGGAMDGGGGDICENRIQEIRNDLRSWINAGGAKGLKLSKGVTHSIYKSKVLAEIGKAKIRCVGPGNKGFPVQVQKTAKICRFDVTSRKTKFITCDFNKFQSLPDTDQYVLIHHEFAGLAGLENPLGDQSTYALSNQISGYLAEHTVRKLVVKPSANSEYEEYELEAITKLPGSGCKGIGMVNDIYCTVTEGKPSTKAYCSIVIEKKYSNHLYSVRISTPENNPEKDWTAMMTVMDAFSEENLIRVQADTKSVSSGKADAVPKFFKCESKYWINETLKAQGKITEKTQETPDSKEIPDSWTDALEASKD